jgi:hypothetical protein
MKRDLSEAQFRAKLAKLGGTLEFMGYVAFKMPHGGTVGINRYNGGDRRRDQLRYLTKQFKAWVARDEAKRATKAAS